MAWGFRTSSYANNGVGALVISGGTITVTLGAAASAGDMLSLHVTCLNTLDLQLPTITVSDSVNGAWGTADITVTQTIVSLGERQSVFSFPNSAAGTPVITVTVSNSTGRSMNVGLECAAFSGLATTSPLDVAVVATGTSATPSSGATTATAAANELVLGFYGDYGEGDTITEGAGYTLAGKHQSDTGKYEALMEYKDSGASGSTPSAGVTLSATNTGWAMFCVVYKLAGGGSTTPSDSDSATISSTLNIALPATDSATLADATAAIALSGTESESLSDSASKVVNQIASPASDNSVGTWTTDTGATTNLFGSVDEIPTNDADYVKSVANPQSAALELNLASLTNPSSTSNHSVNLRAYIDQIIGGSMSLQTELRQGASALSTPATWTDAISNTGVPVTISHLLSSTQAAAITDYTTLRLRFTATQAQLSAPTFVANGTFASTASNGASFSPGLPTGWAAGDLHILIVGRKDNTTMTALSGWSQISGLSGNNGTVLRTEVWTRIAQAGDTAPSVTFGTSTVLRWGQIVGVRSPDGTTPVVNSSRLANASSATVSTTDISPTIGNTLGIFAFTYPSGPTSATQPSGWSTFTVSRSGASGGAVGYATKTFSASGSYGAPTTTASGQTNAVNDGLLIAVQPVVNNSSVRLTWTDVEVPPAPSGTNKTDTDSASESDGPFTIGLSGVSQSASASESASLTAGVGTTESVTESEQAALGIVAKSSFSTNFPATENPLSQSGLWLNGKTNGRDWSDFQTSGSKAYGTESGSNTGSAQFDDSTAILAQTFSNDTYIRTTAFVTRSSGDYASELEHRHRTTIQTGSITGYEVEYGCDPANPYFDIVRWNGALGDFTPLALSTGGTHLVSMPGGAVVTGDVLESYIIGNTISAYKNGVLIATATDSTFPSGHVGIGHFIHNRTASGDPSQWGFSDFFARGDGDGVLLSEQAAIRLALSENATLTEQLAIAAAVAGQDSTALAESIKIALAAIDSTALAESVTLGLAHSDSATLAELVAITVTAQDAAALSEQLKLALGNQDTASLAEAIAIALAHQDTAVLSELVGIALGTSDSAALAELAALAVSVSASDTFTLGESANQTSSGGPNPGTDAGALTEQIAIALAATDGSGLAESIAIALARSDSATLGELVSVALAISEAVTLADQATYTAAVAASDSALVAESANKTTDNGPNPGSDAGAATESASVAAALVATQTAVLAEQAALALGASHSSTLAESIRLGLSIADSPSLTEQVALLVSAGATDSGALIELEAVVATLQTLLDSLSLSESANVSVRSVQTLPPPIALLSLNPQPSAALFTMDTAPVAALFVRN